MTYKYNIVYFHSRYTNAIVLKSSNDESFFNDFDGAYLEDNIHSNFEAVKVAGYGFFKAEITVEYDFYELLDIRIDNIRTIEPVFDLPEPPKED